MFFKKCNAWALPLYTAVCVGRRGCVLLSRECLSFDLLTPLPVRVPYNTHTHTHIALVHAVVSCSYSCILSSDTTLL